MSLERLRAMLADRYTIERELGAGGMATVYLAHDIKHERKVAIKVLKPELAAVLGADRFVVEIKTTASLQHPHILPLFDSGTAGPFLYYVMPYIEGETIREKLNRETQFGVDDAVRIAREVADALDYAHRHGVIHRDIKPENILLHDGRALVMDFGIALAVSAAAGGRMTETGLSLGTPHYMSPEQATAEKDLTPRSDIYSLGSVLYEMLSGQPPHIGGSAQQIIMKIIAEPTQAVTALRKSVPPHVAAAVQKSLEKLPADRFDNARAFADALVNPAFTTSSLSQAHSPPDARTAGAWIRSPWSWLSLAALGACAVMIAMRKPAIIESPTFTPLTFTPAAVFSARFAPDGETLIYSASPEVGTTPRLYVVRRDHPDPELLGPDSTHLLSVSSKGVLAVLTHSTYIAHRLFAGTLATLPLAGGAPREIAVGVREADWAPDGEQMAMIRDSGGTDVLEYPVGTVIARASGYMSDVRVSPSGDAVAYMEHSGKYDDRGIAVIVDRHGRPLARSRVFWGLEGMAWRTDGGSVLFSGATGSYASMTAYELSRSGKFRSRLSGAGGLTIQDVSPRRLLVTRDDYPAILRGRGPGASSEVIYGVRDFSDTPMLSSDGKFIVFSDEGTFGGQNYSVLMRSTDGAPAVRLGEGEPLAISPDRQFVLAEIPVTPPQLMLYPTGPGTPRRLDAGEFAVIDYGSGSTAMVNGKLRYTFCASRPATPMRCYVGDAAGGAATAVTPDGTSHGFLSADGNRIVATGPDGIRVYHVPDASALPSNGFASGDRLIRWSPDDHDVWVLAGGSGFTMRVYSVNPESGRRTLLTSIEPTGQSGLVAIPWLTLGDDPRVYAYAEFHYSSTLYALDGVR